MDTSYPKSVFINCPFDAQYNKLFEAIVFAVFDCGLQPRCSLELDDGAQIRISKISSIIGDCRLGIHDISKTELDETNSLPRFNMPLELGMFRNPALAPQTPHLRPAVRLTLYPSMML